MRSETLEYIIYGLPIFDETETNKPCLEAIAYELGLIPERESFEIEQEALAEMICNKLEV